MKKLAMLMGLLLVLGLSLPTMAAELKLTVSGEVGATVQYDQHDGLTGRGNVKVGLTASGAGADGAIKAIVDLAGATVDPGTGDFGRHPFTGVNNFELKVNSARIETSGAWWAGGPSVNTTIGGKYGRSYSDWVLDASGNQAYPDVPDAPPPLSRKFNGTGLSVESLSIAGLTVDVSHLYIEDENDRATGVRIGADLEGVGLGVVVARHTGGNDIAVNASTTVEGVNVGGTYAVDGANQGSAYQFKVGSKMGAYDLGLTLDGITQTYEPRFRKYTGKPSKPAINPDERRGYSLNAKTTYGTVGLDGTFSSTDAKAGGDARSDVKLVATTKVDQLDLTFTTNLRAPSGGSWSNTSNQLVAKTKFQDISLTYTLDHTPSTSTMNHTLEGSTTVGLGVLENVKLSGKYQTSGSKAEFDATWTAPNGFNLGVHYANYNRSEDVGDSAVDNFYLTAGIKVTF